MSYVLTFVGFALLVILHEGGHFAAAKAVGMRVERFSLFFGRTPLAFRRGETEYGIGWLPVGGYVKITGMSPDEELTPELQRRAYYNQPPWKRIVVILAGPFVNVLIAFAVLFVIFATVPRAVVRDGVELIKGFQVASVAKSTPAAHHLRSGDVLVAIDGRRIATDQQIIDRVSRHRCSGPPTAGCVAATPVRLTVRRDGRLLSQTIRPRYSATGKRMEIGFEIGPIAVTRTAGPIDAARLSVDEMWTVTSTTVSKLAQIFKAEDRRQFHSIVGASEALQQGFSYDTTEAFWILGLLSLSLAIINLFPFLPLDGGHVFWAVAEKLRGRRISFATMERAGVVGFVLIMMLFAIGLSNDLGGHTLTVPR
jgi:regulator of sigma E protease